MAANGKGHLAAGRNGSNPMILPGVLDRRAPERPRIVVIGGGSGSSVVLRGLKEHPCDLTAVVTMFDSGGSSGLLRHEFGYPPFGDLRQCLASLSDESEPCATLQSLMQFRFCEDSSLQGHNLGNLVLAGLTSLSTVEKAIEKLAAVLRVRGQVVPVSLEQADLCAELQDGRVLVGESTIDLRRSSSPRISRVFLEPGAEANPSAVRAILLADAVVLGPGDLYTSILPNLLVRGIPEALAQTRAMRIYVCNLMTKRGETDDFLASDFVVEMKRYLRGAPLDWVMVNTASVPQRVVDEYARSGGQPVGADLGRLSELEIKHFGGPLADGQVPLRHLPDRLAETILCLVHFRGSWISARQPALKGSWAV